MILRGVYLKEIEMFDTGPDEYGEVPEGALMTVDEYLGSVKDHALIDYDGYGHPVKDMKKDTQLHIYPSEGRNHIPLDATHIIWFNK